MLVYVVLVASLLRSDQPGIRSGDAFFFFSFLFKTIFARDFYGFYFGFFRNCGEIEMKKSPRYRWV